VELIHHVSANWFKIFRENFTESVCWTQASGVMVADMSDKPTKDIFTGRFVSADAKPPSRSQVIRHHTKRAIKDPIGQFIVVAVIALIIASLAASGVITMQLAEVLLLAAWVLGVGGSYFLDHLWSIPNRNRLTLAILLALLLGGVGFYEETQQAPVSNEKGAVASIKPLPPALGGNGSYYFPVNISNIGQKEFTGMTFLFGQGVFDKIFTSDEEDKFMKEEESRIINATKLDPKELKKFPVSISINNPIGVTQPGLFFDKDKMEKINSGASVLYYRVVFIYTDEDSDKRKTIYFAELCARFDPVYMNFLDCPRHTFTKELSFPR
jgi:hypothetical protein